jgi:hypothetical protein
MNHLLHFRSRDLRSWFRARLGAAQLAYLQTDSYNLLQIATFTTCCTTMTN